eukprot:SAG31_NODE_3806_length_3866_cov_1.907619_1_plen_451_part_00
MYYPAGSTLSMGPTCILPGGQYFSTDSDKQALVAQSMGAALGLSEFKVTTPLAQGTAIMIHFHMHHRGSKRLVDPERIESWADSKKREAPFRPMVKFQFYSTSEPTSANWDSGPLGVPGAQADWGALSGVHGDFRAARQVTAVWDDVLGWLRGDKLISAPPSPDITPLTAEFLTEDVDGEPRRMGCAYLLGREAAGGSVAALRALEAAITSDVPAHQRCGIWGLVAAGDSATPFLLRLLASTDVALLTRAATALGESARHPTVEMVKTIGSTIGRLREAARETMDGLDLAFVKAQRQLATFANTDYKEHFRSKECHAQDVLVQALWYICSRAVRHQLSAVCEAAVEVVIPLLAEDVDLGQTARMNAAYTSISLGQQGTWASEASKNALADALMRASSDDDRYVVAAAVEGLKWIQLSELGDAASNTATAKLVKKLAWERWCPINSVRAPF